MALKQINISNDLGVATLADIQANFTTLFAAASAAPVTSQGTFVANGATAVTVTDAAITANSQIGITLNTPGGTVGAQPVVKTITPGTGFTVAATASDTSTYNYLVTN